MRRARIRFALPMIALCLPLAIAAGCEGDPLPRFARPPDAGAPSDAGGAADEDASVHAPGSLD